MLRAIGQVVIATICVSATSFADAGDWTRFSVKDVKLGDHLSELIKRGFKTCKSPDPSPKYILIVDKRCDAKSGNTCTIDDKGVDFCMPFINGKPAARGMVNEVEHISVKVSNSLEGPPIDNPRVYQIDYYFPRQLLSEDSPLGKSLTAKYGKHCTDDPSCYSDGREHDPAGGGRMVFTGSGGQRGPRVSVMCGGLITNGRASTECWMSAEDSSVLEMDRTRQTEANMKAGENNQPPPPRF
jgi:hypothetical protein